MKHAKLIGLTTLFLALLLMVSFVVVSASTASQGEVRVIITVNKEFDEEAVPVLGGKIIAKGRLFPIVVAELPASAVEHMKKAKGVARIEHDAEVHLLAKPPSPPGKSKQNTQPPQQIPWGIYRIGAPEAWNTSTGSSSTIEVAILDTGIDFDHPDLVGNLVWGVSTLNGKVSTKPKDYRDRNGHGTHVAGTIAALNNEIGVVGVAPDVELYAIKVLGNSGRGWISDIVLGIEQALLGPDEVLDSDGDGVIAGDPDDDAAEVISMSFGSSGDSQVLHDALRTAYEYGIVLVAASGNDGASSPSYPAAYPEVIAVGATDSNDQVASWSNRGAEITAPGVNILSTYPDDTYETLSGTSMAAPHVSGVVALIQSAYMERYGTVLPPGGLNNATNTTVRGVLYITSDDLGAAGWDADYGYGVVRADLAVQVI